MSQTVQIGFQIGRRDRAAEDVGVRAHLEQQLELVGAADEAAQAREALRQRADDQRVVVVAQGVEHGAASLPADDAGAVGVIDVEDGAVVAGRPRFSSRQRRQLAAHAVDAVDGHHGDSDSRRPRRSTFSRACGSQCEKDSTRVPLALAILAPS